MYLVQLAMHYVNAGVHVHGPDDHILISVNICSFFWIVTKIFLQILLCEQWSTEVSNVTFMYSTEASSVIWKISKYCLFCLCGLCDALAELNEVFTLFIG
jgi:hypothetical protein